MDCKIKGLATARVLEEAPKIKIDPGYFESKEFIEDFGDWTSVEEGQGAIAFGNRVYDDGSPALRVNKNKTQAFYVNKDGYEMPIFNPEFKSVPLDDRDTIAYAANDAMMYGLYNYLGVTEGNFQESLDTLTLSEIYDLTLAGIKEGGQISEVVNATLINDKEDHMNLMINRLRAIGIRYTEKDYKDEDGNTVKIEIQEEDFLSSESDAVVTENDTAVEMEDADFSVVRIASYQRAPSSKVSSEIKFMLEFIIDFDHNKNPKDSIYVPNTPVFMDPSTVYAILLENISSMPALLEESSDYTAVMQGLGESINTVNAVFNKLESLQNKYPWMMELVRDLRAADDIVQLQFVANFQNSKNDILVTEYNPKTNTFESKSIAESANGTAFLTTDWTNSIINHLYGSSNSDIKKEDFISLSELVRANVQDYLSNTVTNSTTTDEVIDDLSGLVDPFFKTANMDIDAAVLNNFFNTLSTKHSNASPKVQAGIMGDKIVKVINSLTGVARTTDIKAAEKFSKGPITKVIDPLALSYNEVHIPLADHMATVGAKRVYLYSAPTVIQRQIEEWIESPDLIDKILNEVPSLRNSVWLKNFKDKPGELDKFKIILRGVLQEKGDAKNGKDGGDIGKADYLKTDIFNVLRMLNGEHKPTYPTQTPADKSTEFLLQPGGNSFIETPSTQHAVSEVFIGYVKDELAKMQEAHKQIQGALAENNNDESKATSELIVNYHFKGSIFEDISAKTLSKAEQKLEASKSKEQRAKDKAASIKQYTGKAFEFQLFPELNSLPAMQSVLAKIKNGDIDDTFLDYIDGKFKEPNFLSEVSTSMVNTLNTILDSHDVYLKSLGIDLSGSSDPGIDMTVYNTYKEKYKDSPLLVADNILRDYVVNSMISKIEYAKLFTGNLNYYKSAADYIKRVPETYIDGKPILTGLTEGDLHYKQIIFATESFESLLATDKMLDESVQAYYESIDRTDAQGWITPNRWEFILRRTGKIDSRNQVILDKLRNQWKAVINGKAISLEDHITTADAKILSAQALKGVYFKNDLIYGPMYVKYSQAVLIPSVAINNPKMLALLERMSDPNNPIDEAVADTAVKVGGRKPIDLQNAFEVDPKVKGKYKLNISDNNIMLLDNRNWRLQQDLPTKGIKNNKIGTQIQKIIISNLRNMSQTEEITDGYTGPQLADAIDTSLGELSDFGISKFLDKYGIGDNFKISSLEEFYAPVLRDMKDEGIPFSNLEKALKGELSLPAFPHLQKEVMSSFMANLNKAATNLIGSGGGFIQVSDHLIGIEEIKQNSGIKLLIPLKDFKKLEPPKIVETKDGKVLIPGQAFIPHSMIVKLIPNYRNMELKDLNELLNSDSMVKRMIGYRIPTQSRASTDLFDIVGILPPDMGDSVIAYGEITAKTGSDFDIDKMYFMIPELEEQGGKIVRVPYLGTFKGNIDRLNKKEVVTVAEGENINSKGSELAKKLTNPGNTLTVEYKGETFRNAEHAYQTWKSGSLDLTALKSKAFKPKGTKKVNPETSHKTMTEIITAKLEQHPELVVEITEKGGLAWLDKSTHEGFGDKFWEGKNGGFMVSLKAAYATQVITQPEEVEIKENLLIKAGVLPTDMRGHAAKDIAMAEVATQFIGEKSGNAKVSSTEKYKEAWGDKANTGVYSQEDIIMISGSGPWRGVTKADIDTKFEEFYKPLLTKVVEANASVVVGRAAGIDTLIQNYMVENGYKLKSEGTYLTYISPIEEVQEVQPEEPNVIIEEPKTISKELSSKEIDRIEKGMRNKVFGLFEKALLSPQLYGDMMTSIDNPTTENQIGAVLKEEHKALSVFTPKTAIETLFNLKSGKSGIGDMVNANNDHIRSQGKNIYMEIIKGEWGNMLIDREYSEELSLSDEDVNFIYEDMNDILKKKFKADKRNDGKPYKDLNPNTFVKRKISNVLSELTNAFVDIANKDSFITKANWGAVMNSYGTMLLRNGIHPIKVFSIIRNPIISDYLLKIQSYEGIIDNKSSYEIREELFDEITNKLMKQATHPDINSKEYVPEDSKLDQLNIKNIYTQAQSQKIESAEEIRNSYIILKHFTEVLPTVKKYSAAVTTAKVGETGTKATIGDAMILMNKNADAFELDDELGFYNLRDKYFDKDGNATLLMKFHENTVGVFNEIIENNESFFPSFLRTNRDEINLTVASSSINKFIQSPYLANQIVGSIGTYYLSEFSNLNREYSKDEQAELNRRFFELKDTDSMLAKKLLTKPREGGGVYFYMNRANQLSNTNKNSIVNSWEKLLRNDRELGEYLINRSFIHSGFQYKRDSFHEFIPTKWFLENGINNYVKFIMKTGVPPTFFDQAASNTIGQELFNKNLKLQAVKGSDKFFRSDTDIGFFKEKTANGKKKVKYPLYGKNRDNIYKLLGTEIISITNPAGKKSTAINGIYVQVPKVQEGEILYISNSKEFDKRLGILSRNDYINEFKALPTTNIATGWTRDGILIPVSKEQYRMEHSIPMDIIQARKNATQSKVVDRGNYNLKKC